MPPKATVTAAKPTTKPATKPTATRSVPKILTGAKPNPASGAKKATTTTTMTTSTGGSKEQPLMAKKEEMPSAVIKAVEMSEAETKARLSSL